jgi:putative MATE family efflux protein
VTREVDRRAVEAEAVAEEFEDPEAGPALPSAALAAHAGMPAAALARRRARDGRREIWALSWPVMFSQVLLNAVSLIDIAMVGRLGSDAVAAVGYATQFFFLSQSVLFAVGFACVALMARAIGAGDPIRARLAFAACLAVAGSAALVLVAAMLAAPGPMLRLLGAQPHVVDAAVPYLSLVIGSSAPLALSMTIESALRADRDTRTPMAVAAIVTAVKLGLNGLLIFGAMGLPRLELVGAGIATLVSQVLGLALFLIVLARAAPHSPLALRPRDLARSRPMIPEVVRIALPSVGERLANNLALLAYFRILSGFGTLAIAAYTVGVRLLSFSWIPGVALGTSASTLVGQALGADDARGAERAGWRAMRLSILVAVVLGLPSALLREPLARLFTDDPGLVAELSPFLLCLALVQPALQAHFALGGAHRGAGDTWTPFVAATLGNWLLRVPLAAVFAYVLETDVIWIWIVIAADHVSRMLWLAVSFRRGAWRERLAAPLGT